MRQPKTKDRNLNRAHTSVYFANREVFEQFDAIMRATPRGSMSNVINQLVAAFVDAYAKHTVDGTTATPSNIISVHAEIKL